MEIRPLLFQSEHQHLSGEVRFRKEDVPASSVEGWDRPHGATTSQSLSLRWPQTQFWWEGPRPQVAGCPVSP